MSKKILLTTMPAEGEFVDWTTPKFFMPKGNKNVPLGILSLATNLSDDYEIVILDPSSEGWTIDQTIEKIESEKPDILGLSVVTRRVYAMTEILRRTSAPYKVVGGPHTLYYSEKVLQKGADAVFIGPLAELEFAKAVKELPKGVIQCNTQINDIKFPDRTLINIEDYFPKISVLFKAPNRLPMFSSIGCPNNCNFCNVQTKKVQFKNPKTIVEEMKHLYSVGCRSVHILDDNFNINKNHVQEILDEMDRQNFSVELSGRGQVRMDFDLAPKLAAHNFKRIHVGIESLNEKTLEFFRKNNSLAEIKSFCEVMNKNNIDILGYFILGAPTDDEKYLAELPEMIRKLGIKYPYFNILFPEPNTDYYQSLLKEGFYKKDYWAEYMKNPTPYFEIPYPYGERRRKEIIEYVNNIIEEFKSN